MLTIRMEHNAVQDNPKLKTFEIMGKLYKAFTKGEARAQAKRDLGYGGKHDRLPAGTVVTEVGKQLTQTRLAS